MLKTPGFLPLCGLVLALSACGGKQPEAPASDVAAEAGAAPAAASAPAAAGPEARPGLSATGGVLVLPVVPGRPAAAYFSLANGSEKAVTLAGVHIDGAAKAEMHETKGGAMAPVARVDVPQGASVRFERGGKHVMAFNLEPKLKAGGTTEMTLTFSDGDKISVPMKIEARTAPATGPAPAPASAPTKAGTAARPAGPAESMEHMDHMEGMDH